MNNRLNRIYNNSKKLKITDNSKIVIMSDCHRGSGNSYDNFLKNKNIYKSALKYYYKNKFSYIELGDGDDMWEVHNYNDIIDEHLDIFKMLKKFDNDNRLIMIYGNHDICKKDKKILKKYFYKYYDSYANEENLLNNLIVYESLVLDYKDKDIFMLHGHQVDLLNGTFWRLARFLVRHVWKNLERFGIRDLTRAAKNYAVLKRSEKKLKKWSIINNTIIIAGHTHRPIYPEIGESLYFNDGSCVHPNGITCLEIENGIITLVKWVFKLEDDKLISVGRVVIEGGKPIIGFFKK